MPTALVTGGAGYIGSHAVDLLIHEGHDITVLDTLESGHREAVHPAATFVQLAENGLLVFALVAISVDPA